MDQPATRTRPWLNLSFAATAVLLLAGCLGTDKPKLFQSPAQLMNTGYWDTCMSLQDTGYSCITWKVRAESDGRVVALQRSTTKNSPDDQFVLQATSIGPSLYMFQMLQHKEKGSKGPYDHAVYGFVRKHQNELDAILPDCKDEALAPILAAMSLKANPKACRLTEVQYSEKEVAGIMRAYAASETTPISFRYRLSKLADKEGAERWEREKR